MIASSGTGPAGSAGAGASRGAQAGGAALVLLAAAVILLATAMALGPSAAVPTVGPAGPMVWLAARPSIGTVIVLERAGLLLGALATVTGLAAAGRGWQPPVRLLLGVGALMAAIFVVLPPAGSIDVLNYAIYGRIAALGHNPYLMRPVELLHAHDPVGRYAPANWRTLPTVYGPVATAAQWAAARAGGASMARIVFWIRLGNAVAYLATATALLRLAGPDQARRRRVCLLWAANPVMAFWLVGSGHVDVLLALIAVTALVTIRSQAIVAAAVTGLLAAAGTAIKTPFAFAAAGLGWTMRRSPRALLAAVVAAAAAAIPCYLLPGVINTAVLGRRLTVSAGFIYPVPAWVAARPAVFAAAVLAVTAGLAALLGWRLPAGDPANPAVRPVLVLALAWLAVFPVQAPWYDALIFPLLALMPASRLDYLLSTRCLLLSEMLLPGVLPDAGRWSVAAARLSHAGLLITLILLIVMCVRRSWHAAPPAGHRERAPEASAALRP
jgi:hypothetical protein